MKKIICILFALITTLALCACNFHGYDWVDTNYHFNRAIVRMPDGTVEEIAIEKWADAEVEQLTITAKDGTRYLVSSVNCILIEDNG